MVTLLGSGGKPMMFDDNLDEGSAGHPEVAATAFELEEITMIKRMMALPDSRPDPGIYRHADYDEQARDLLELAHIMALRDPRPLMTPWIPYSQTERASEGEA